MNIHKTNSMTREITIEPVLNGYICRVGCCRIVFQAREQMFAEIKNYLEKPAETEQRFLKNAVNKMSSLGQVGRTELRSTAVDEPVDRNVERVCDSHAKTD